MFILDIIVGAFALVCIVGLVYCLGWAIGKIIPRFQFLDKDDGPFLTGLFGLIGLCLLALVLLLAYVIGIGVLSLFK